MSNQYMSATESFPIAAESTVEFNRSILYWTDSVEWNDCVCH